MGKAKTNDAGIIMNFDNWILFIVAVFALMSTPGPSQLLMLSNSATYGLKNSLATILGDLSANLIQMIIATLGIGLLIASFDHILIYIKWMGVTYLAWNALKMILSTKPSAKKYQKLHTKQIYQKLFLQGFLTSASNPKAILFFAALFPQFISTQGDIWMQFVILSCTYILIDGMFLLSYGFAASKIVRLIKDNSGLVINKIGGGLMLVAAMLLGFKSIDQ